MSIDLALSPFSGFVSQENGPGFFFDKGK